MHAIALVDLSISQAIPKLVTGHPPVSMVIFVVFAAERCVVRDERRWLLGSILNRTTTYAS